MDPFDSSLLGQDRLFLGRQVLRNHLRTLCAPVGPRALVVNGPDGSGKSHTVQLIRYLSEHIRFRVALVNLEVEAFRAVGPSDLAQNLIRQMGGTAASMPEPRYESVSRYVLQLGDWLISRVQQSDGIWWFVFDGFDHVDVPLETRDFITRILEDADVRVTNLRMVLLGWSDDLVSLSLGPHVLRETIVPFDRGDLRHLFEQLSREGALQLDQGGIDQVVEAVERAAAKHRGVAGLAMAAARAVDLLR
jgi:hypothetical protein